MFDFFLLTKRNKALFPNSQIDRVSLDGSREQLHMNFYNLFLNLFYVLLLLVCLFVFSFVFVFLI